MPKKIEDVRLTILREARPILLKLGYDSLNLRDVAKASGIAVSTVYHYFDSKDDLVFHIFDADWQPILEQIAAFSETVCDPIEGLRMTVYSIREFITVYSTAWIQYRTIYRSSTILAQQHEQIIQEIYRIIHPMMLRFQPDYKPILSRFLSQTVVALAAEKSQQFDTYLPIFEKLCKS